MVVHLAIGPIIPLLAPHLSAWATSMALGPSIKTGVALGLSKLGGAKLVAAHMHAAINILNGAMNSQTAVQAFMTSYGGTAALLGITRESEKIRVREGMKACFLGAEVPIHAQKLFEELSSTAILLVAVTYVQEEHKTRVGQVKTSLDEIEACTKCDCTDYDHSIAKGFFGESEECKTCGHKPWHHRPDREVNGKDSYVCRMLQVILSVSYATVQHYQTTPPHIKDKIDQIKPCACGCPDLDNRYEGKSCTFCQHDPSKHHPVTFPMRLDQLLFLVCEAIYANMDNKNRYENKKTKLIDLEPCYSSCHNECGDFDYRYQLNPFKNNPTCRCGHDWEMHWGTDEDTMSHGPTHSAMLQARKPMC